MKGFSTTVAALLLVASFSAASAAGGNVTTLEQLNQMFANMRTNTGYKKWNVDGDLLWGYFFTDKDPKKLEPVKKYLVELGYRFVDLYPTDDKSTFFLHVEKIEHHTAESLFQRNKAFYELADQFHIESYDGMDVGPVGK